ncbi:hypothetical protein GCM10010038_08540 [Glutamicibacter protophormiae]|nr:hypothetical protein GCM10010038_08540 [Glutamicibacter protophormiae]
MTLSVFSSDTSAACAGAASETERHKTTAIEEITLAVCFKINTQVVESYDYLSRYYITYTTTVKTNI